MSRRLGRALLVVALVAAVSLVPVAAPGVVGGSQAGAVRTFGSTPLDDVLYWADQHKKCGLTRDYLAALMIPVTYPETGAPWNQAPSPMTLSRWDNQSGLYAFSSPGSFDGAFWHPGVGMFAFDEAGAWGMTAAARISSWSSAQKAAETMANRWCANPERGYVWSPWHGCNSGKCESIFHVIIEDGQLVNVSRDLNVSRNGGMESRTCVLDLTTTVTCWFVDPSLAQGYRGFVNPVFGPSPISEPFYVYELNGNEFRTWMKEDTGYQSDITAFKPLPANSRTSLTWEFTRNLCDHANGKGPCGTFLDVPPDHPFFDEIEWMHDSGITSGYADGTYRPLDSVTRQAMSAFLFRLAGSPPGPYPAPPFPDVPPGHPFIDEIDWMASEEIASGFSDGTFRPRDQVTRQAMAAFLYRLAGSPAGPFPDPGFTDVRPGHPFIDEISWMAQQGITSGYPDGSFGVLKDVTRQAMAAFLERYAN